MSTMTAVVSCASWLRAAGAVDHLGLGRAAVDDEGAREPGGDVGRAEADQVDVLVERVVVLGGVGPGGGRALGEDQHEDRGRGPGEGGDVASGTSGKPKSGRPPGTVPSVATPWAARSHSQLTTMAPITARSAPGIFLVISFVPEDRDDHAGGHGEGGPAHVADVLEGAEQLADRAVNSRPPMVTPAALGDAEHAAHLASGDLDADAGQEADEHACGTGSRPGSRAGRGGRGSGTPPAMRASSPARATYSGEPVRRHARPGRRP